MVDDARWGWLLILKTQHEAEGVLFCRVKKEESQSWRCDRDLNLYEVYQCSVEAGLQGNSRKEGAKSKLVCRQTKNRVALSTFRSVYAGQVERGKARPRPIGGSRRAFRQLCVEWAVLIFYLIFIICNNTFNFL